MKSDEFVKDLLFPFLTENFDLKLDSIAFSHQSHSTNIIEITSGTLQNDTDGWITSSQDVTLIIHTADCVPILLWSEKPSIISLIHAGWKGTSNGILEKAIHKMVCSGANIENIYIHLGPAINDCCYEVDKDVAALFTSPIRKNDKLYLNLIAENRNQSVKIGIQESHIYSTNLCTACNPSLFHSYRRDKILKGQMFSIATIQKLF